MAPCSVSYEDGDTEQLMLDEHTWQPVDCQPEPPPPHPEQPQAQQQPQAQPRPASPTAPGLGTPSCMSADSTQPPLRADAARGGEGPRTSRSDRSGSGDAGSSSSNPSRSDAEWRREQQQQLQPAAAQSPMPALLAAPDAAPPAAAAAAAAHGVNESLTAQLPQHVVICCEQGRDQQAWMQRLQPFAEASASSGGPLILADLDDAAPGYVADVWWCPCSRLGWPLQQATQAWRQPVSRSSVAGCSPPARGHAHS